MRTPVTIQAKKRRHFDKYESYGAYHWRECDPRSRTFNPPLVARYRVVTDRINGAARVVEIGAGDGCLTALLARSGAEVTGVEVEETAVRLASTALKTVKNCAVLRADCYRMPFPSQQFDVAVMADVIEHLDEPDAALAEAVRVLKPSGTLLLTTPKWRPDRVWDAHHVHEYTASEIDECLKKHFRSIELCFFWPLVWSNFYRTKVGWRALREYARYFPNPFSRIGSTEHGFGQILAICKQPLTAHPDPRSCQ